VYNTKKRGRMIKSKYATYIFVLSLIALFALSFLIIKPFLISIITSVIASYVFYPVFAKINGKIKRPRLSSIITISLIVLIIILPLFFAFNILVKEARVNYVMLKQKILSADLLIDGCNEQSLICSLSHSTQKILSDPKTKYYLDNTAQKITNFILDSAYNILFSIPILLINFFIMIFIMFYLFKDGAHMIKFIERISPLKKPHNQKILNQINDVSHAVIYGYIIVALVQGTLGAIGFVVLGVSAPLLLGILMAFFALIPFVGTPIVWLPVALFQILNGYTQHNNVLVIKGIILIIYGFFIISTIDNILKPKIIGDKAKIHPILVLLGVLGGLNIFGFIGIIVGPVVLAILLAFIRIYQRELLRK